MGLTKDALRPRSDAGRGRRSGVKEDAARPERVASKVGEAARREAASLLLSGRPARVEAAGRLGSAMPQACGIGRGERRTPTDWFRTKRKTQPVPGVQRMKRSTPTARPVPSGRRTNVNFNRRTEPRTKDQGQLRRFGPSCLRRTNVKFRSGSIPSWETLKSTRATGITHPGFYGWKPWKKPNNASIITAPGTRCEGFRRPTTQIVLFGYRKRQEKFT